jgi:hypothetical protein
MEKDKNLIIQKQLTGMSKICGNNDDLHSVEGLLR